MISECKNIYADRATYQKSGEKSYLVLSSGEEPEIPYQINMIRYNQISGLLPVQFFIEDGEYKYFYDISCRESLVKKMSQKKFSIKEIRTVMSDLYRCIQQMEEYLLDTSCLILNPEYMFSEKDTFNIQFCFYADKKESFEKSLEELFDYFLNQLDYQDERTVVLVYSLYQKSREEHTPLYELMKQFCEITDTGTNQMDLKKRSCHEEYEEFHEEMNGGKAEFGTEVFREEQANLEQKYFLQDFCKKYLPFLPDVAGGYGIARIIWYISKHHTEMSGKTFMMWMFAVAGILVGCGMISTVLSTYLDKKMQRKNEECSRDVSYEDKKTLTSDIRESIKENITENEREAVKEAVRENIKTNLRAYTKEDRKENVGESREKLHLCDEKAQEEELFEEFEFQDDTVMNVDLEEDEQRVISEIQGRRENVYGLRNEENHQGRQKDSVPATVVMSEPELFRAFNPVLLSFDKEKFQDIVLKDRKMVIGKVRGIADICLEGKSISRVHARICQDKKGCSVTDMGSTNGTYINGVRLAERQRKYLQKGDEVRFAEAVYEFFPAEMENVRSHQISDVI